MMLMLIDKLILCGKKCNNNATKRNGESSAKSRNSLILGDDHETRSW